MFASCSQPKNENPLLQEWNTPYGIPPFEQVQPEHYLPAYKAAVDAGVESVMTAFNTIDGIPAVGNKWLVDTVLRKEWKYDGVVISDYNAFRELIVHSAAEDEKQAACMQFTEF